MLCVFVLFAGRKKSIANNKHLAKIGKWQEIEQQSCSLPQFAGITKVTRFSWTVFEKRKWHVCGVGKHLQNHKSNQNSKPSAKR